jgi:hypothetical protein
MGRDPQFPSTGVGGQEPGDGRRDAPSAGALVEAVRDGPGTEGVAGDRVGEGGVEVPGVVLVEEAEQGRRVAGDELAAPGEGVEEGVGVGAGLAEAIPAAELVGPTLGRGERGQVILGLDALAAVVTPGVAGDLRRPVEEADSVFRGHEDQRPPNQGVLDWGSSLPPAGLTRGVGGGATMPESGRVWEVLCVTFSCRARYGAWRAAWRRRPRQRC